MDRKNVTPTYIYMFFTGHTSNGSVGVGVVPFIIHGTNATGRSITHYQPLDTGILEPPFAHIEKKHENTTTF